MRKAGRRASASPACIVSITICEPAQRLIPKPLESFPFSAGDDSFQGLAQLSRNCFTWWTGTALDPYSQRKNSQVHCSLTGDRNRKKDRLADLFGQCCRFLSATQGPA
jgi:hypothetical protein